jgi:hypothetical protein
MSADHSYGKTWQRRAVKLASVAENCASICSELHPEENENTRFKVHLNDNPTVFRDFMVMHVKKKGTF